MAKLKTPKPKTAKDPAMTKAQRAETRAKLRPLKDMPPEGQMQKKKRKTPAQSEAKPLVAPGKTEISITKAKQVLKLDTPEDKPSKKMYAQFQHAYDFFNKRFWSGALPNVILVFNRKPRSAGYFHAQRWTNGDATTHEVALNPDLLKRGSLHCAMVLLHEMCHVSEFVNGTAPKKAYHNRAFFKEMLRVGLHCSSTFEVGGKETGTSMGHYVEPNGPFTPAFDDLLKSGWSFEWSSFVLPAKAKKKSRQGKRVKYTCPETDLTCWGRGGMALRAFPDDWEEGDDLPPLMQEEAPEDYGEAE